MNPPSEGGVSPQLLAAYVDGDVTPSQAGAVERALERSPDLRRRADDLRRITTALSAPLADLESLDLSASVRAAAADMDRLHRAGLSPAEASPDVRAALPGFLSSRRRPQRSGLTAALLGRGSWRWPSAIGLAAAGAAALALLMVRPARPPAGEEQEPAGMRAKSASAAPSSAPERWAGISVYRVAGGGSPERLGERISRDDGLLFTYTNLGSRPFTHLMIYAVDASGQVRWFHPAYQQAGTNPASIAIEANANVPLAEVVRHPFATGPATFQALFSRRPLRVDEVEGWLAGRPAPGGAPPWPDSYRQILTTSVERPR